VQIQIGPYNIIKKIDSGGMATVYLASHRDTGARVAIKLLRGDLLDKERIVDRFRQEGLLNLSHPNIVKILGVDIYKGRPYIVMEYVEGTDLEELIKKKGKLPISQTTGIFTQILSALSYVHARGIIHRDIKPKNILIDSSGVAKLTDFGIAKSLYSHIKTSTGGYLGAPAYSSPEQMDGKKLDQRSDIYSLGITLYEMLAGRLPYSSTSIDVIIKEKFRGEVVPVERYRKDIPQNIVSIIARSTSKSPQDRYRSVDEIIKDMASSTTGTVIRKTVHKTKKVKKPAVVFGALAALLMVAVVIMGVRLGRIGTVYNTEREGAVDEEEISSNEEKKMGGEWRDFIMEPLTLDPSNCYESEGIQVVKQLWDGLVEYDPETLVVEPAIAESWDISDDGLVYTFKLKNDVKFHSGRELTAEDFVYSWSRVAQVETESYLAYHLQPILGYDELQIGEGGTLEGVKAINNNTLEVTLKYPYADFINTLNHVVFYPVAKEDIEEWGDAYSEHPNGTGAFKFIDWKHDQYIQLERFDDYHGEKAFLEKVNFMIFSDEDTAFLEFKAGKLDHTEIPLGKIQATLNEPTYEDCIIRKPLFAIYYYAINYKIDPFKDNLPLREAINYAINRQKIVDLIMEGVSTIATGVIPPGIPGFQENISKYVYNTDMAKQKLEEAGYPNGEGLPTLRLGINFGTKHHTIAEAIQSDLADVGINAEIVEMEWWDACKAFENGEIDLLRLGWVADYPTMDNFLFSLFYSNSADNYLQYNNPEIDSMLIEARSIMDEDERIMKYREIEKIIVDESAAFIFIYCYGSRSIIQPYVKGFILNAMDYYDLRKVWFE